jgi:hypothetical protein
MAYRHRRSAGHVRARFRLASSFSVGAAGRKPVPGLGARALASSYPGIEETHRLAKKITGDEDNGPNTASGAQRKFGAYFRLASSPCHCFYSLFVCDTDLVGIERP